MQLLALQQQAAQQQAAAQQAQQQQAAAAQLQQRQQQAVAQQFGLGESCGEEGLAGPQEERALGVVWCPCARKVGDEGLGKGMAWHVLDPCLGFRLRVQG